MKTIFTTLAILLLTSSVMAYPIPEGWEEPGVKVCETDSGTFELSRVSYVIVRELQFSEYTPGASRKLPIDQQRRLAEYTKTLGEDEYLVAEGHSSTEPSRWLNGKDEFDQTLWPMLDALVGISRSFDVRSIIEKNGGTCVLVFSRTDSDERKVRIIHIKKVVEDLGEVYTRQEVDCKLAELRHEMNDKIDQVAVSPEPQVKPKSKVGFNAGFGLEGVVVKTGRPMWSPTFHTSFTVSDWGFGGFVGAQDASTSDFGDTFEWTWGLEGTHTLTGDFELMLRFSQFDENLSHNTQRIQGSLALHACLLWRTDNYAAFVGAGASYFDTVDTERQWEPSATAGLRVSFF